MPESRSRDEKAPIDTGIGITGPTVPGLDDILTDEACAFVAMLERRFGDERRRLLEARAAFQAPHRCRREPGLPARHPGDPRGRLDHCGHAG